MAVDHGSLPREEEIRLSSSLRSQSELEPSVLLLLPLSPGRAADEPAVLAARQDYGN